MHACGHDGHMANLLTFAQWLSEHREKLHDDVVLLFQPAEETTGGARNMIEEGALEDPHVEVVYGMHMMPDVPLGKVSTCAGPMMAQTCEMDFIIRGLSAQRLDEPRGHRCASACRSRYRRSARAES